MFYTHKVGHVQNVTNALGTFWVHQLLDDLDITNNVSNDTYI